MLRPRSYPQMLGKALVLEADPFITMAEDDNPWMEGLFMTVVVGLFAAAAVVIGGALTSWSLPPADAVEIALLQAWRQLRPGAPGAGTEIESGLQGVWDAARLFVGYDIGWARLLLLIVLPLVLILQWFFFGVVGDLAARALGGTGSLSRTLGAVGLIAAPQALLLARIVPFVSVSSLLLMTWTLLITYRAFAVAHELPWRRAIWAALAPFVFAAALSIFVAVMVGIVAALGGG